MRGIRLFSICLFVFWLFLGCGKDSITDLHNGITDGQDNYINEETINDKNDNSPDVIKMTIDGNWTKNPDSPRSLELDFNLSKSRIIFRNYQYNMNKNTYQVINRSFSGLEYDGETIKFLTYLDPPTTISFSGTLSDDKLIISGLRSYAYKYATTLGYPVSYIDLLFWNGTYYRKTSE